MICLCPFPFWHTRCLLVGLRELFLREKPSDLVLRKLKPARESRMKLLALLLLLVLTLVTYGSAVCTLAIEVHTDAQNYQHEVEKKLLEETGKVKAALEYSGSTVDNHHNIPRNQYDSRTGGNTEDPPEGDYNNQGNGTGDANNLLG
ncbi:uncharacterized protein A4U43_C04F17940 [Asparagus officinalis]|uniref:Uncharacterized protein n=1 Tax=Asparagus officinalis TaxID=4686 RepID=A0A5P1F2B5_ASPOF|nr:uncharacterized protein LOC109835968 [Asparagus officinalis]ONK72304.1 uncharacterized protein A4U43_C04F17940 [Asparagus officinalis]